MINGKSPSTPVADRMERMLAYLWERRGTDLLLTAGAHPLVRVDGELHPVPDETMLRPADTDDLVASLLSAEDLDTFRHQREVDFAFSWDQHARVRGNAFVQRGSA